MRTMILLLAMLVPATYANTQGSANTLEAYAKASQFIDIKISPTGSYLAATSRGEDGNVFLSVIDIKSQKVKSTQYFKDKDTIGSFNWANDERILIQIARLQGALEIPALTGELFAVNADGSKAATLTGSRARQAAYEFTSVASYLPEEEDYVLIASSPFSRSAGYTHLKRLNIYNGRSVAVTKAPLRSHPEKGAQLWVDNKGVGRLAFGVPPDNEEEYILLYRAGKDDDWKPLRRWGETDPSFSPLAILGDNKTIVGLSNTQTDTMSVSLLNPDTGKEEVIATHPGVDLAPVLAFEQGTLKDVIGASYDYDEVGATFFSNENKAVAEQIADFSGLMAAFSGKAVQITSATRDNALYTVKVIAPNEAPQFYFFDAKKKQLSFILNANAWLDAKTMPTTRSVIYKSRDGKDIHAVLTLPANKEAKALPLIMHPHGGPHGPRDSALFVPGGAATDAKVLAQQGYAVLQPNFRGSGGFGRSFEQAGYLNWGTTMIDDMTDGVNYLAEQGIIDKNRVCSYGGSYGGYAALMSAVREPDLYKCVVGFVGVYDLNLMYTDGDIPERESGVRYLERVIGRDQQRLDALSPLKQLDRLKAPVFIIHGGEDKRVPIIHAHKLKETLEARNHPYVWLVKDKEGHGFYKPEHNVERWQKMIAFFEQYIGK